MLNKKEDENRKQVIFISCEDLVPEDHILRDIEKAINFKFIYEEVKDLYSDSKGRPSIDPVVLFKIILIQYIFGIRSMRQTIKDIEVNVAYRWFLGYGLLESIPHFTTFGKNYSRRFADTDIFEKIFERILDEAINCGFVDTTEVFVDATHIKACANNKKYTNEVVKKEAKHYQDELKKEINKDRENHDKKPLKDKDDDDNDSNGGVTKTKNIKQSKTDPESGYFHKGEHKKVFAYSAQTACDKNNYILATEVFAGNLHDSTTFDPLYKKLKSKFSDIEAVVLDSGYKTPYILKQIFEDNKIAVTPYKRPMTKKGFLKKYEYVYDEYYDCVICPNAQILKYTTTNKNGYKEFKSNPEICKSCPHIQQCTNSKNHTKVVTKHVWDDYLEMAEDVRLSEYGKDLYSLRKETIERVFADAKEKHNMRYTQYRGKNKVKMQVLLTFACQNLKKLAKYKKIYGFFDPFNERFFMLIINFA